MKGHRLEKCILKFALMGQRPPPDVETALFRIAQEALTNVAKHAHASTVRVIVQAFDQPIRLEIADDGVGFMPKAIRVPGQRWSLGLSGMQERAASFGGRMVIESTPGQGTRIIAEEGESRNADRSGTKR